MLLVNLKIGAHIFLSVYEEWDGWGIGAWEYRIRGIGMYLGKDFYHHKKVYEGGKIGALIDLLECPQIHLFNTT